VPFFFDRIKGVVQEPTTLALLGLGGLLIHRKKRADF
jgi:hypothetical protein